MNNSKPTTDCFITFTGMEETARTAAHLHRADTVASVTVISPSSDVFDDGRAIITDFPLSVRTIRHIADIATGDYVLLALGPAPFIAGSHALERMAALASCGGAAMLYGDYREVVDGRSREHPLIDYREGSLRDDFDFGPVQLFRKDVMKAFAREVTNKWEHAGFYALRLLASRMGEIAHVREFLFTAMLTDTRRFGEKIFDYVSAAAQEKQAEMEEACTAHLRKKGALLMPPFREAQLTGVFPVEATIVIPVRNRAKTISDAVDSALSQQTSFPYNIIVVDNHSTDGTTDILRRYDDDRLLHLIPGRADLGIGGCWNEALAHLQCGKFAVQLDSDDLYADEHTLQKIVDKFYEERCAMVVGSYRVCDFNLNPIPPGVVDHREWTPANGVNNALRINGLGAPRAFFTPVLRQVRLPDVSYGEDYAACLAISRIWKTGRIYDPVYLCRRWEGNSDASPDITLQNAHNAYKDSIRTFELQARIRSNANNDRRTH